MVPFPKDRYVVLDEKRQDIFTRVGYELDLAYIQIQIRYAGTQLCLYVYMKLESQISFLDLQ